MFLSARITLFFLLAIALAGCDTCNKPGSGLKIENLVGTYVPDQETYALLTELGLDRTPSIVVHPNGSFEMVDMPTIWRDWIKERPLGYEKVSGDIGMPSKGDLPITFDVNTINNTDNGFFFAGSQFCATSKGMSIQFPYRGWDIGEYLVFVPNET